MSKKILFLIDRLSAGAGRVVYDLVKFLDKEKFEPVVAEIYPDGDLSHLFNKLDLKIINLNKKKGKDIGLILRLKDIIKKEEIDVVHTHNVDAYEYGVLAGWLAGVRVIHTAHGKSVKQSWLKKKRENIYHRFISLFLDKYVSVSKDLGKYAVDNWCFNKKKIKVIYNGVDIDKYHNKDVDKSFLKEYNIDDKDKLIGIAAGLRKVKNHSMIIRAMKLILKEISDAKLLIVGDGKERKKLERLVNKLDLSKKVLFLGNRKDMVNIFNCLDVNVLCSFSECLSMTLLEAMACEVPCVVTDVGGNPELIKEGVNGYLVDVGNVKALANRIIKLLEDKNLRKEKGKKSRKRVVDRFSVKDMIEKYEGIYESN